MKKGFNVRGPEGQQNNIGAGIRIGDMGQPNSLVPLVLGGMHLEADSMHLFIKWWSRFFIANDGIIRIDILQSAVQSAISTLQPPTFRANFENHSSYRGLLYIFHVKSSLFRVIKTNDVKISKFGPFTYIF